MEDQTKIFNEFTQFNARALQGGGGSGLGLWICRNLAALHGGRMVSEFLAEYLKIILIQFLSLVAKLAVSTSNIVTDILNYSLYHKYICYII